MVSISRIISTIKAEERKKQKEIAFRERQKKYKEAKQKEMQDAKEL